MAHVTVMIGGRSYRLACNEGEEPHLEGLARQIDSKIAEIRGQVGEIGDQRLVVMAALTIADELFEARRKVSELERKGSERDDVAEAVRREADEWAAAVAEALSDASRRIEDVAAALAAGGKG
ncbi:MAG TPA: cell division protein ZapA [Roseiarcus sp.]|jgi:cell division protein ZapA|nr:cell division protein ZapA [Roseiarcus sp.]HLJ71550.1 cell division protein ZapA [Roseiarcus sp.]